MHVHTKDIFTPSVNINVVIYFQCDLQDVVTKHGLALPDRLSLCLPY